MRLRIQARSPSTSTSSTSLAPSIRTSFIAATLPRIPAFRRRPARDHEQDIVVHQFQHRGGVAGPARRHPFPDEIADACSSSLMANLLQDIRLGARDVSDTRQGR